MIIELHVIQSFAPSNLNRDDIGAPKDADFGGVRRARISSQCLKRAMRRAFAAGDLVPPELRATRTKRVVGLIADHISASAVAPEDATRLAEAVLAAGGIKSVDGQVGALMFIGADEIAALGDLALAHRESLLAPVAGADAEGAPKAGKRARPGAIDLTRAVTAALQSGRSVDVALFGRMIAELPAGNVDAAAQVAHAISTHRVERDFDYYTAMDDLARADESGAAMVDTVEFNAATYYRYVTVDATALAATVRDADRTTLALEAFVRSAITAEPTGKQNSFAAHNPPSYVLAVVRDAGNWSLANAFLRPVRATQERDLVDVSVDALEAYWEQLVRMYGTRGLRLATTMSLEEIPSRDGIVRAVGSDGLVAGILAAVGTADA